MKRIIFYTTASGRCPVQDHLDKLPDKTVQKIAWVLKLVREMDRVPAQYFKKLTGSGDIWEIRADVGHETYRLLGFFHGQDMIVLTNSFQKKSQQTPQREIELAKQRRSEYQTRR